jgi:hypothetical protein
MVTKEQLEYWYRRQEEEKAKLPLGSSLGTYYYSDSGHEPFSTCALILQHLMFSWECDHPAPGKRYWTFTVPEGLLCLSEENNA